MFMGILKYSDAFIRAKGTRFFFWEGLGETQCSSEFQERWVKLLPVALQYSITRQSKAYPCMQKHRYILLGLSKPCIYAMMKGTRMLQPVALLNITEL